jgi:hypothetical protein
MENTSPNLNLAPFSSALPPVGGFLHKSSSVGRVAPINSTTTSAEPQVLTIIAWCWLLGSERWRLKDARLLGPLSERSVGCYHIATTHVMRVDVLFLAASAVSLGFSHIHYFQIQSNLFMRTRAPYREAHQDKFILLVHLCRSSKNDYWEAGEQICRILWQSKDLYIRQ